MSKVAALVPALNCSGSIAGVVAGVKRFIGDVLVVDDGSSDDTEARAAEAGAEVVRHPVNRGKGAALATGLQILSRRGFSSAVAFDGDGQHLPEEIPALLEVVEDRPGSLVIGARRVETEEVAGINLFGNRFADWWVARACGRDVGDTQSGFRVYPLPKTLELGVRAGGFAFETEVLVRACRAGVNVESVPVRVHYDPPDERVSHYRRFRDTARIVAVVIGLLLRVW